jgi:hypothetical protein
MYGGRLVKLGTKTAELHVDQPVAAFSNLKLHLLRPSGEVVPEDLFAKVVETLPEDEWGASRSLVWFHPGLSSPRRATAASSTLCQDPAGNPDCPWHQFGHRGDGA